MRTIKDPKRKPEVRRRTDYDEEEEEDTRSTKSTPPKKRKTNKSFKDDSSSLNDSGSFVDNQSDRLSEKSSAFGEDDISDVSSLKSTPPKKRNYSKIINKSPEINGDPAHTSDGLEAEHESKAKGPKRNVKKGETEAKTQNNSPAKDAKNKKLNTDKKPVKGSKKVATKDTSAAKTDKNHLKDVVQDVKKSPKGKKNKQSKPDDVKPDPVEKTTPPKKKGGNRKRKLNNDEEENEEKEASPKQPKVAAREKNKTESTKDTGKTAEIQSKKLKKSKKQLKEEATLELKRQTEEQRNAHLVVSKEPEAVTRKKKVPQKKKSLSKPDIVNNVEDEILAKTKDKSNTKQMEQSPEAPENKSEKVPEKHDIELPKTSNGKQAEAEQSQKTNVPNVATNKPVDTTPCNTVLNNAYVGGEDDDFDESSDLDTSFESINSTHDEDRKLDNSDRTDNGGGDKVNESMDSKTEDKPEIDVSIKCDRCGYVSRSKGGHTRHLRKCQPEQFGLEGDSKNPKVHVCEKCDYSAPRRVLVINHMKSHGIYQCKRCQFRTDNEETLDEHSGQEHKDRSDCKFCKLCNRYVKCSDVPLEKHMEECKGRIPFRCPECSKEFQYESSLKCHVVSHYPDQPKLFSCDQCDYKSNYKANLKKHIRHIHEQRGEKTIKCPDCEKLFHTEDNMRRHQKLHSDEKPHKCEQEGCDKAFKTLNGLKFHLISHQTERPFACEVEGCSKDFKSKKSLAMHLNETHQNAPKNFHCTMEGCDMAFYKKCHFERHMAAHTDNRTFFCRWVTCTKAFRTAESLKTHALVHTDEKPVKCEHCDYTCRQRNSIRFHMKKKHPELLPPDLKPSDKTSKQGSQISDPATVSSKAVADKQESNSIAEISDNKENLNDESLIKSEPSSPVSDSPDSVNQETDKLHSKTNDVHSPSSIDHRPSKTSTPNHVVHQVTDQHKKLNVPSKNKKESTAVLGSVHNTPLNKKTDEKESKETPAKKAKKTDMYEFMSEDESEDEMKPGLLRKEYDKDKPPLPSVTGKIDPSVFISDLDLPHIDNNKKQTGDKQKVKKKTGPRPKPSKPEAEPEVKVPKKRGRKKKSETEKKEETKEKEKEPVVTEITKPKRGRSPKAKKAAAVSKSKNKNNNDGDDEDEEEEEENEKKENPVKKKRGPKKKAKPEPEKESVKVPKKRGRKKKVKEEEKKEIEPENGDATINYSEVESDKMFADSKDGVSDQAEAPPSNIPESRDHTGNSEHEVEKAELEVEKTELDVGKTVDESNDDKVNDLDKSPDKNDDLDESFDKNIELDESFDKNNDSCNKDENEAEKESDNVPEEKELDNANVGEVEVDNDNDDVDKAKDSVSDKGEDNHNSDADSESSDIGSDFDEDLKPPPAPRPPPMYDSEDGDIESGPENEDGNGSLRNERLRDFESSREISREISRDFESSREIDDSVKTSDANSVETYTPKEAVDTPSSVNPYKNDSVGNDYDNQETPHPHSHHSSVPHTPSHSSIPSTPITSQEYESQRRVEETVIKSASVQGQPNDENTDESSMPEVDKDYVGRFFEEIQCNQQEQISRLPSMDENSKSQDKVESRQSDSGVQSSLPSNQTEASIQMQSPPTDLSHKRLDILPPSERSPIEEPYQARPDSVHRISDRIPNVPSFEPNFNTIDPYASSPLPPRDTILRQTDQAKIPSPLNASTTTTSSGSSSSFMRFPDSEAMLQRQRMTSQYDRNIQNLHRIADTAMPPHNTASPLIRHVPGREDVFPGAPGVTGSMSRNPFHSSWTGQDVRPPHWSHAPYLQRPLDQQAGSTSSSLFGKESYLPGREFMFDPSRAAAERNMFSSLASSHSQRPEIPHDTFQLERFDLGSYLSSHPYNTPPTLPVDYTRSAHSSTQKSLDERYRQSTTGVTDFRTLPQSSTASDMFGMNSSFNLDKFYSTRESMYHHSHNISDNTNNPFLPSMPGQHSMFGRDYTHHRSFYTQNSAYPFVNMNDKNYSAAASAKLGHSASAVGQQRELVPVPRPNMAHEPQLQDPYRHSSMLYNMMNRYFE